MTKPAASSFNPFALPGLDLMKDFWSGAAQTVPQWAAPSLSVEELDKKITDLRAVQAWLDTNASLLRTTIQSLEVQRHALAMAQSMGVQPTSATSSPAEPASAAQDPANAWWNMLQEQFTRLASTTLTPPNTAASTAQRSEKKRTTAAPRKRVVKPRAEKKTP